MIKRLAMPVSVVAFILAAGAGDVTCDFSQSSTNTAGWTLKDVKYSAAGRMYFNNGTARIESPVFDYPVTQLLLEGECASENTTRTIVAVPMFGGQETADTNLWRTVTPGNGTFNHRLLWNSKDGVKAFRLKNTGRSGCVYFDSARVRFVSPPEWMYVSRKWRNAAEIAWETPPDAEKTVVELKMRVDVAAYSHELAAWRWDRLVTPPTASASANVEYDAEATYLKIGNAKNRGYAEFANPPLDAKWLRIRASIPQENGYGTTMPICSVGPDGTNTLANLKLTPTMTDYRFPVAFDADTRSIVFWSTTNNTSKTKAKATVMMEYARFEDEYRPATNTFATIASATVSGRSSVRFKNLNEWSTYYAIARSISPAGAVSGDTEPLEFYLRGTEEWLDLGTRVIMR